MLKVWVSKVGVDAGGICVSLYSSVVSFQGFRMLLFISELNDIETWTTNISSAYFKAYTVENACIKSGPEFGSLEGHLLIIDKTLYKLHSSGAFWHDKLADSL